MIFDYLLKPKLEPIAGVFFHSALRTARPPFVFYVPAVDDEERALDGATGLFHERYELHVVASALDGLQKLADAVKKRLISLQGQTSHGIYLEEIIVRQTSPDIKESEVDLYRLMFQLDVHYQKEE